MSVEDDQKTQDAATVSAADKQPKGALTSLHSSTDKLYDWSQSRSGKKWRWYIGGAALMISTTAALLAVLSSTKKSPPPPTAPISAQTQADIMRMLADGKLTPEQATQLALAMTGQAFPETPPAQLASMSTDTPQVRYKESVEALATSDDVTRRSALALINNPETRNAGFTALSSIAKTADDWRQLGRLAFPWNNAAAINAYTQASQSGSQELWDYISLARLYQAGGDLESAKSAAKAGLPLAKTDRDKTAIWDEIGKIAADQGDLSAARSAVAKGLTIREALARQDPENTEAQRDLSVSHNKIGNIAAAENDLAAADAAYKAGLKIRQQIAEANPGNPQLQNDLAVSHNKVGGIAYRRGEVTAALAAYAKSLEIIKTLAAADPANMEYQRDLSISYERIGTLALEYGDPADARIAYDAGRKISERLAASDPSNAVYQRGLYISLIKISDAAIIQGDLPAAKITLTKGLETAKRLADADPTNTDYQRDVAAFHFRLTQAGGTDAKFHIEQSHRLMKDLKDTGRLQPADEALYALLSMMVAEIEK